MVSSLLTTGSVLVVLSSPHDWVCFLISKLSKKFLNFFAPSPVPGCSVGLVGLCTQQIQRDETGRNPTKIFSISATRWLNANHSLYIWKTLLTKSAVAGFQLWVSSLAAFCLANRRFSLVRDKEVDVRWLVLVLGCQLVTCSDARQGSRSSRSTVSYVLHTQRCCCLVRFSVLRL